jgi:hypothetical protein
MQRFDEAERENGDLEKNSSPSTPLVDPRESASDDRQLKLLQLLLLMSGLRSKTTVSLCAFCLSLTAIILTCGYIYHSFEIRRIDWAILCHVTFAIHGAVVYILLAFKISQQLGFFSVMAQLSQPLRYSLTQKLERHVSIASSLMMAPPQPCSSSSSLSTPLILPLSSLNLQFTSQVSSAFVITIAMINFVLVAINVGDPIAAVLSLPHSLGLKITGLVLWFFYSLGWFLPMALVCPPMIYMLQKIFHFERFISAHLSEDCDIDLLMHWYSELYDSNVLLQKAFGSLVTVVIVIGGVLEIVLIMVTLSLLSSLSSSTSGPLHHRSESLWDRHQNLPLFRQYDLCPRCGSISRLT